MSNEAPVENQGGAHPRLFSRGLWLKLTLRLMCITAKFTLVRSTKEDRRQELPNKL